MPFQTSSARGRAMRTTNRMWIGVAIGAAFGMMMPQISQAAKTGGEGGGGGGGGWGQRMAVAVVAVEAASEAPVRRVVMAAASTQIMCRMCRPTTSITQDNRIITTTLRAGPRIRRIHLRTRPLGASQHAQCGPPGEYVAAASQHVRCGSPGEYVAGPARSDPVGERGVHRQHVEPDARRH